MPSREPSRRWLPRAARGFFVFSMTTPTNANHIPSASVRPFVNRAATFFVKWTSAKEKERRGTHAERDACGCGRPFAGRTAYFRVRQTGGRGAAGGSGDGYGTGRRLPREAIPACPETGRRRTVGRRNGTHRPATQTVAGELDWAVPDETGCRANRRRRHRGGTRGASGIQWKKMGRPGRKETGGICFCTSIGEGLAWRTT